jgi:hypothetical protein
MRPSLIGFSEISAQGLELVDGSDDVSRNASN